MMTQKVITGGQRGTERAALDSAARMGIAHQGWILAFSTRQQQPTVTHHRLWLSNANSIEALWEACVVASERERTVILGMDRHQIQQIGHRAAVELLRRTIARRTKREEPLESQHLPVLDAYPSATQILDAVCSLVQAQPSSSKQEDLTRWTFSLIVFHKPSTKPLTNCLTISHFMIAAAWPIWTNRGWFNSTSHTGYLSAANSDCPATMPSWLPVNGWWACGA
jgi:hypothetical protein